MQSSLTIDRTSMRQIAAMMALVMMIASLPAIGVIVISDHSGPSISMDVCHPLQSIDVSTGALPIARPAASVAEVVLDDRGSVAANPVARTVECPVAPDTPPPKQLA